MYILQADADGGSGYAHYVAEGILQERVDELRRRGMPANHSGVADAARLLDMLLMSMHTPADNNVQKLVQDHVDSRSPETLQDLVKALKEIPEYE